MYPKTMKLNVRRARWVRQFKPDMLRGSLLNPPPQIARRYYDALDTLIMRMQRETLREVRALFNELSDAGDGLAWAADANIGPQARILTNALRDKFAAMFARLAQPTAQKMADQTARANAVGLGLSLKDISGGLTIKTDIFNDGLRDVLAATVAENVALIKRIPQTYLDNVTGSVMRAIQNGNGLADIEPQLKEHGVKVRNWAHNVSLDQTRKAYNGLAKGRMEALGLDEYEWVHSGGSDKPREYHRDTLNGKIFKLSDPPVIDPKTGERGIPGQLPYCRCKMRPILKFNDDDE